MITGTCRPAALLVLFATSALAPLVHSNPLDKLYASIGYQYSSTDGTVKADQGQPSSFPPESVSLNGAPFEDDDNGWSAAIGYQFLKFFAVEVGYEDLGRFGSTVGTTSIQRVDRPFLEVDATFLKAQFQYPLGKRFAATWHVGVARSEFKADGMLALNVGIPLPIFPRPAPLPEPIYIPFADPGRETGYFFGFGASWRAHRHLDVELSYSRKDLEVLEFDTVGLRVIGRL